MGSQRAKTTAIRKGRGKSGQVLATVTGKSSLARATRKRNRKYTADGRKAQARLK